METCPHCQKTIETLQEHNITFVKKSVFNESNRKELLELYNEFNVPLDKSGTILVRDKDKECLIIGEIDEDNLNVLNCSSPNKNLIFKKSTIKKEKLNLLMVILPALVDSINPCVLAIMSMLLTNILTLGRSKVLIHGLVFTFTVTFAYFLMGLSILKAFIFIPESYLKYFSILLLLILGILQIKSYFKYNPWFLSVEMPNFLKPLARKLIKKTRTLTFTFFIALILSLFLVPCSSGPYLAILSLISSYHLNEKILGIFYLVIYNLIFSLPMVIITFLVYFGLNPNKIKRFRNKNVRLVHLISGIILLIMALLLIIFY